MTAVNRDGYASAQSTAIVAGLPGVTSYVWLDSQHMAVYFSEPLTSATATVLGNYTMTGGITFSAVALARNGTVVTLTTNQAVTAGNAYTITMTGLATVSGDQLPASLPLSVTYQNPKGTILDQVWDNLDGGDTINDLTSPALNPNYPNNPTYTTYLTSFNAPYNTGVSDYGQRVQGYIYPPTTGNYVFWIASDDYSQLWLSTNSSPTNIGSNPIAYVNGWTNYQSLDDLREPAVGADFAGCRAALLHRGPDEAGRRGRQPLRGLDAAAVRRHFGARRQQLGSLRPSRFPRRDRHLRYLNHAQQYDGHGHALRRPRGFVVGQSVTVSGASQSAYNGTFVITAVSGNTFSYTVSGSPTTPATGNHRGPSSPSASATAGRPPCLATRTTVTPAGHGSTSAGATPATYNGTVSDHHRRHQHVRRIRCRPRRRP